MEIKLANSEKYGKYVINITATKTTPVNK